jgi:uncharacterized protein (DUF1697 family)
VPRCAVFLRGINLGRHRRVGGAELRSLFEDLGFRDVATFRTSGNVVFEFDREPAPRMTGRIEMGLAKALGYEVAIFLRTASQIRALADHQPFSRAALSASKGKLQVVMLPKRPAARTKKEVLKLATGNDKLAFGGRELYWLPSSGTRDSGLDLKVVEKALGPTTMRTKGTIDLLAAKYFAG